MTERGILFTGPNVRSILDGRKTQTRRVMRLPKWFLAEVESYPNGLGICAENIDGNVSCPYGLEGDRLWVRESFQALFADGFEYHNQVDYKTGRGYKIHYMATEPREEYFDADEDISDAVTPSIFMPRWASRILLEVTDVRAQRVQDISEADAIAEGCRLVGIDKGREYYSASSVSPGVKVDVFNPSGAPTAKEAFAHLWDSLNDARGFGWDANPLVWAITFRRLQP